jgi:hypothetical protein
MRKLYISLLLCCFAITQGAWAQETLKLFDETFDTNNGKGGKGKNGASTQYSGNIANNKPSYDNDGWSGTQDNKINGGYQCIKFGTGTGSSKVNGICTTPDISYVSANNSIILTFEAVGWASDTNMLLITATGADLSGDINITLQNGEDKTEDDISKWKSYTVTITPTAPTFSLTFTGWRGFLDNVKIIETVTTVPAPTLTDNFLFWPNTTEGAVALFHISPSTLTTAYYTIDGTSPTTSSPNIVTMASNVKITSTTTVKAKAYVGNVASPEVTRTYTVGETVNSIAAFKAKDENDEVRLFIADDANARVLHKQDGKMYLRDNTGTICVDLGSAAFNPTPNHNQHVAGWIVGKKQTVNGLPKLTATTSTNTNHLALAAPVTEAATTPVAIATNEIGNYVGDWVTMENVRNGNTIAVTGIYDNALVDVSGIITANNTISPVDYNDIEPIVYVIDEDENFVSPNSNIVNATLRLKRTLKAGIWNTFTIPMDLPIASNIAGKYRSYTDVNGDVLIFSEASSIEAGKPYLVKPDADVANPVFTGTLSATPAQNVEQTGSNIAFKGIYSPTELKTDKTEQFLTASGKLGYPSSSSTATLKGMRAYFYVPAGTEARVFIEGEDVTGIEQIDNIKLAVENYYNLNGQRISKPTKGLYIVNGKKVVIK